MFAIALLTCFFVACNSTPKQPLKIGTGLWAGYEPLYLARELGYFGDSAIQLVEYSAAKEVNRAFQNGAIDIAGDVLQDGLFYAESDPDNRVFLLLDVSDGGDALIGQSEIKNLKDLQGSTIGFDATLLSRLILVRALQSVDLQNDDINPLALEFVEQKQAFNTKKVDALITYEPILSALIEQGATLLFDSSEIPGEIVDVLVGHKDLENKFSKELQVLLKGWFKALDYIENNPDDAIKRMAERQGGSQEQFIQSLKGLSFVSLSDNQALLSGENTDLLEGAKRLSDFLKEQDLLKKEIDLNNLFDDGLVKIISP
ncbi:MAG: ABC transporter substrate-binding protein [Cyanobacteria bacterium P01_E01_bin.42]